LFRLSAAKAFPSGSRLAPPIARPFTKARRPKRFATALAPSDRFMVWVTVPTNDALSVFIGYFVLPGSRLI